MVSSVVVATDELNHVFGIAREESAAIGDEYIGTGALLVALADERSGNSARLLREVGVTADRLRESLKALRQGHRIFFSKYTSFCSILLSSSVAETQ